MNGVPEARAPRAAASSPGRSASSTSSAGSRNVIATVDPGGERRELAQRRRGGVLREVHATPVDATTAGRSGSKPAATTPSHQLSPASKSTGTRRSQSGTPKPSSTRRRRFHAWVPGWSTSKIRRRPPSSGRRCASVSRPAPRMTYWSTPAATCSATRSSMNAGAGDDGCPEAAGAEGCMSGRSRQPSSGCDELQADEVLEHGRRRVDLDVQRAPERDPYRGAVGRVDVPARHDAPADGVPAREPGGSRRGRPGRARSSPGCPSACPRTA